MSESEIKSIENWRMTALSPRFVFVDARAALFIPPLLVYPRTITFVAFLVVLVMLSLLERKGYTVPVAMRIAKLYMTTLGDMPVRIFRKPDMSRWRDRYPL